MSVWTSPSPSWSTIPLWIYLTRFGNNLRVRYIPDLPSYAITCNHHRSTSPIPIYFIEWILCQLFSNTARIDLCYSMIIYNYAILITDDFTIIVFRWSILIAIRASNKPLVLINDNQIFVFVDNCTICRMSSVIVRLFRPDFIVKWCQISTATYLPLQVYQ